MMERMMRRVSGTAWVRVSGDTARFVNILVRSGIFPLEMQAEGEDLLLLIRARQFRKLHGIKLRTHTRVKLVTRSGLPFALRRILKRPGIPVGIVLATALYLWLSGFYWCVELVGEAPYAKTEILSAAAESGVYIGVRKKEVDLPMSANRFLRSLPDISWASFNSDGCRVTLDFRPAVKKEQPVDKTGAYDVIARRDGVVKKIAAQGGTVIVDVNAAVKAGQTLVSGVALIKDPWDPEKVVRHLLSHARAEILAETRHTFSASCPLKEETMREVSVEERKVLRVLGLKFPISLKGARSEPKSMVKKIQLSVLGTDLPVWLEIQQCVRTEPKTVAYTTEQAQRRALEKLRVLQKNYLGETGRILAEEITFSEKAGVIYAVAHCTVEEDIAVEVPMGGTG